MSKARTISTDEAKSIKVARWISEQAGFQVPKDEWREQGQIWIKMRVPFSLWAFLADLSSKPSVACLNLESPKNWVMSVYGRDVLAQCEKLAQDLAVQFDTHVHVKLVQEIIGAPSGSYD